jgi:hypothetical protein
MTTSVSVEVEWADVLPLLLVVDPEKVVVSSDWVEEALWLQIVDLVDWVEEMLWLPLNEPEVDPDPGGARLELT